MNNNTSGLMKKVYTFIAKYSENRSKTILGQMLELFATYILNIAYICLNIFPQRDLIKKTKGLKNTKKRKKCFVFANGPSINLLDYEKVLKYQKLGFDIICMNSYIISKMAEKIIPNYYILSDPLSFCVKKEEIPDDLLKTQKKQIKILNDLKIPVFIPAEYSSFNLFNNYYIFYNFGNRFKLYVDPTKPRGYPTTTAHKALTVACYLGYDEIYICGFDHDFFKNITVDENNNTYFLTNHYYDIEIKNEITPKNGKNVSILLWEQHQLFKNLERFKKYNIINLDKNGLVDAFTKKHDLDIYIDV